MHFSRINLMDIDLFKNRQLTFDEDQYYVYYY